ncbi:hypothetical protein R4P64_30235 [Rhodococcus sp. IEGM 1366]|nr:hypothetical protein [Rhodococcus sp. IEGM 1366]
MTEHHIRYAPGDRRFRFLDGDHLLRPPRRSLDPQDPIDRICAA